MLVKALTAATAAVLIATCASAHPKITASAPAANSTVSSPKEVSVTFDEKLTPKLSTATLTMTSMPGMSNHPPMAVKAKSSFSADAQTLVITPTRPLPAGTYRVDYKLVAANAHKVEGGYSFTVR